MRIPVGLATRPSKQTRRVVNFNCFFFFFFFLSFLTEKACKGFPLENKGCWLQKFVCDEALLMMDQRSDIQERQIRVYITL